MALLIFIDLIFIPHLELVRVVDIIDVYELFEHVYSLLCALTSCYFCSLSPYAVIFNFDVNEITVRLEYLYDDMAAVYGVFYSMFCCIFYMCKNGQ